MIPPIITDMLQMQSFEHLFIDDSFPFMHGEFFGYNFEAKSLLIVAVSSRDLSFSNIGILLPSALHLNIQAYYG